MIPELAQRCLVCGENLIDADKVCDACAAPYHSECWTMNEGCARLGCVNAPMKEKIDQGPAEIIIRPEQLPMRTKLWAYVKNAYLVPVYSAIATTLLTTLIPVFKYLFYPLMHPVISLRWCAMTFPRSMVRSFKYTDYGTFNYTDCAIDIICRSTFFSLAIVIVGSIFEINATKIDNILIFLLIFIIGIMTFIYYEWTANLVYNFYKKSKTTQPPIWYLLFQIIKFLFWSFPIALYHIPGKIWSFLEDLSKQGESILEEQQSKLIEAKKAKALGDVEGD